MSVHLKGVDRKLIREAKSLRCIREEIDMWHKPGPV